ncbi:hypothetical protein ACFOLC_15825 [Lysobacter cavernae]|uniref:DUF1328 domain-containing protein n=1 Tax=Lysobacter cavernae TaxID=1685901 RepID=A0ABV7RUP8_9GAMM
MESALKLMLFFLGSAGAFFALDKLISAFGVTSTKAKNALAFGGVALLVIAFFAIFGFDASYQVQDWPERARR